MVLGDDIYESTDWPYKVGMRTQLQGHDISRVEWKTVLTAFSFL